MWPVTGQSTLDAMWVLDWGTAQHDVSTGGVVAGGFSMGADTYRAGRDRPTRGSCRRHRVETWLDTTGDVPSGRQQRRPRLTKEPPVLTVLARRPLEPDHPRRELRSCIPHRSISPPRRPRPHPSCSAGPELSRSPGLRGPDPACCGTPPLPGPSCSQPVWWSWRAIRRGGQPKGDGRLGPSDLFAGRPRTFLSRFYARTRTDACEQAGFGDS
jgi:hypothetical protein